MTQVLLMVGTQKGAFFFWSDEARRGWRVEGPLLKGWEVLDLQLDQRRNPTIFAGIGHFIWGSTIHVSRDFGRQWQQVEHSPRYEEDSGRALERVWCIAPGHSSEPETLFAGVAEAGLFASRDGGVHWQEVEGLNDHPTRGEWAPGLSGLCCHTVLVDPANKRRMWAAISAGGVFRTENGGANWERCNSGLPINIPPESDSTTASCVHSMVVSPDASDVLYMQHHDGVFRSVDGGSSWHRIEQGLPSRFGMCMAMHPKDSRIIYVLPLESPEFRSYIDGKLTVYKSIDGGESWRPSREGLPGDLYYPSALRQAMATDSFDQCGVYFGTTGGHVFFSSDEGESWGVMPEVLPRILCVTAAVLA